MKDQINDALVRHAEKKKKIFLSGGCNVLGAKGFQTCGSTKTYSNKIGYSVLGDSLPALLSHLDSFVSDILKSAVELKTHEKPEGGESKKRNSEIFWRQFPEYQYDNGFIFVYFRMECRHVELTERTAI